MCLRACIWRPEWPCSTKETGCSQYELTFSLRFERAECELLSGNFEEAEQLIADLLQHAASKVDQATAYRLKVVLHTLKSENAQAVDSALSCLRLFGIDIPAHPTQAQVQAEYETVWRILDGRPIESLIDLPMMTDPEMLAAMQVLSALLSPAYHTDFHLWCLLACRMGRSAWSTGRAAHPRMAAPISAKSLDPYFTATARVIDSPSSPATLSRSTALSPSERKSTMSMGNRRPLDAADRDRDRFPADGLSHRN